MPDWSNEETENPLFADDRNFYKVEKWTKDGMKIDRLLYAGNNLDKARELFAEEIKRRPRIRLTIRQRRAAAVAGAITLIPYMAAWPPTSEGNGGRGEEPIVVRTSACV